MATMRPNPFAHHRRAKEVSAAALAPKPPAIPPSLQYTVTQLRPTEGVKQQRDIEHNRPGRYAVRGAKTKRCIPWSKWLTMYVPIVVIVLAIAYVIGELCLKKLAMRVLFNGLSLPAFPQPSSSANHSSTSAQTGKKSAGQLRLNDIRILP